MTALVLLGIGREEEIHVLDWSGLDQRTDQEIGDFLDDIERFAGGLLFLGFLLVGGHDGLDVLWVEQDVLLESV